MKVDQEQRKVAVQCPLLQLAGCPPLGLTGKPHPG